MNDDTDPLIRWSVLFKESPVFDLEELRQEEIKSRTCPKTDKFFL